MGSPWMQAVLLDTTTRSLWREGMMLWSWSGSLWRSRAVTLSQGQTHTPPPPPPPNSLEMYCTKDYILNHWSHVLVLGNSLGMRWILQLLAFCGMIPPMWAVVTSLYVLSGSELACRSSTPSPELSSSPYNSGKTQNNSDIMWLTKSQSIPQSKLLYE